MVECNFCLQPSGCAIHDFYFSLHLFSSLSIHCTYKQPPFRVNKMPLLLLFPLLSYSINPHCQTCSHPKDSFFTLWPQFEYLNAAHCAAELVCLAQNITRGPPPQPLTHTCSGDVIHERIFNSFSVSRQSQKKREIPRFFVFSCTDILSLSTLDTNVSAFLTGDEEREKKKAPKSLHTLMNN